MSIKILGSSFIIAGTAIGAGMLAMPISLAGLSAGYIFILLFFLWAITCYTALLMVEVYQHVDLGDGLATIAKRFLGKTGHGLATFGMLFLLYALTAAYLSGGGELVSLSLSQWLNTSVHPSIGVLLFTLVGGTIIFLGTYTVDVVNRILFIFKMIFFVIVISMMTSHIQSANFISMPFNKGILLSAIPIVFTSFGFHSSIPSVAQYLQCDNRKLHKAIIIGSFIPLVVYLLWQLATLGSINPHTFLGIIAEHSGVNALLLALNNIITNPFLGIAIRRFADLALATSFLGVTLGLFDYLADLFKIKNNKRGRLKTAFLTFLPPILFALFYPEGFIKALGFAAIALSILALVLPSLLVLKTRKLFPNSVYRVKGGRFAAYFIFLCGIIIIVIEIGNIVFYR